MHGYLGVDKPSTSGGRARARKPACTRAPKEQPPRKLSGTRTAGVRHLWRAGSARHVTRRASPTGKVSEREHRKLANLSGPTTEGECGRGAAGPTRVIRDPRERGARWA